MIENGRHTIYQRANPAFSPAAGLTNIPGWHAC
jgi:hypothetical protein